MVIFNKLLAKLLFWTAQGVMMVGRLGQQAAHQLLTLSTVLAPGDERTLGWLRYTSAVLASRRGDTARAVELLREASRLLPDNVAIQVNLGVALTMLNRYEQAIEVLERVLKTSSDIELEASLWSALAWSYLRTGRYAKVATCQEQADEFGIKSPELQLIGELARGCQHGRLHPDVIGGCVAKRPRTLGMVLDFADWQARSGNRRLARKALGGLPREIQMRGLGIIASSALNDDNYETVLWAAAEYGKLAEHSAVPAMLRSEVALRRGAGQRAIEQAQRAVKLEPHNGRALEQLGRAHLLYGDREQAARAFVECLATGSDSALAGGVVAMALLSRDEVKKARLVFRSGRRGDALGCAYAHAAHALLMARQQRWDEAVKIAQFSWESVQDLPAWTPTARVLPDVGWMLGEALTQCAQSGSPHAQAAAELLAEMALPTQEQESSGQGPAQNKDRACS